MPYLPWGEFGDDDVVVDGPRGAEAAVVPLRLPPLGGPPQVLRQHTLHKTTEHNGESSLLHYSKVRLLFSLERLTWSRRCSGVRMGSRSSSYSTSSGNGGHCTSSSNTNPCVSKTSVSPGGA